MSLQARDVGVRTPRLRAIAEVGSDSMLLAYDHVDGRDARHRRRRRGRRRAAPRAVGPARDPAHAPHRAPRPPPFEHRRRRRRASPGSSTSASARSPSSTRCSTPTWRSCSPRSRSCAGAERAVDAALAVLGVDAVARRRCTCYSSTRSAAPPAARCANAKGLLKELQTTVAASVRRRAARSSRRSHASTASALLTLVMLVLVVYFLLPQFSDLPGIVDQVKEANWIWFVPVCSRRSSRTSGATFAIARLGARTAALRPDVRRPGRGRRSRARSRRRRSVGMALNVRYLQKSGVDPRGRGPGRRAQRGRGRGDAHRDAGPLRRLGRQVGVRCDPPPRLRRCSSTASRSWWRWPIVAFADPRHPRTRCATAWSRRSGARCPRAVRGGAATDQHRPAARRLGGRDVRVPHGDVLRDPGVRRRRSRSRRSERSTSPAARSRARRRRPAASARSRPRSSPDWSPPACPTTSRCRRCSCSASARSGCRSSPAGVRSRGCRTSRLPVDVA